MFIGEFSSQLGEKNRVAIPKKLRVQMQDATVVTRGYEQCLILVDQARWELLVDQISKNSLLSLDIRDSKRFIVGGAQIVDPDNQGRIVLSESLLNFAQINDKLVFVGVGEWIEIWPLERWEAKLKSLSSKVSDIADRLSKL